MDTPVTFDDYRMETPVTPAEWQDAVDSADALLRLDSARQYGLVSGGPNVNVPRCEEILKEGTERGFAPRGDNIDRLVAEIA